MCVWWMIVGQVYGYLFILLAYTCLYLWWWMHFGWPCVASNSFFLKKNLGHHILFYLLCEITCHIAFLLTSIYLFTHTCCTPRIAKFRGSFCLGECKSCIDDSNWYSNSCIHQGGALHKFWGSKSFRFFHSYKSLSWLSSITKKGEIESAIAPYVGFSVLMTSKLGTNAILMRYVAAISPTKDSKSW